MVVVGSVAGTVTLRPGDTLGYDCGTVWIVPRPDSYRDPVRRLLAEARVPQRALVYSADPVEYTESWQDTSRWPANSAADPSMGEEATVLGKHQKEWTEHGDCATRYRVTGGEAIVVRRAIRHGHETTTRRPRRVERIIVRPTANKAAVREWLFEELTLEGAARRREREIAAKLRAAIKKEFAAKGSELSEPELDEVVGLYRKVVAALYLEDRKIEFNGVHYQMSWWGASYGVEFFRFFWYPSSDPHRGSDNMHDGYRSTRVEFVQAYRSGLLKAWADSR
jgi:hypothetical protein